VHESQSRLWENLVARGRPFCELMVPELQAAFPDVLSGVTAEAFYRAVNRVEPSLIRVEADEVTYNVHIILRFELERELVAGRLAPRELPEAWNAAVDRYLRLEVPDDAHGVLQDAHWSGGAFGYFPSYTLSYLRRKVADVTARGRPPREPAGVALRTAIRGRMGRFRARWGTHATSTRSTRRPRAGGSSSVGRVSALPR
jgi:hypothetical protein